MTLIVFSATVLAGVAGLVAFTFAMAQVGEMLMRLFGRDPRH